MDEYHALGESQFPQTPKREKGQVLIHFLDAEDEAMQRYKESLGLGGKGESISDPNDPRVCIILSLTMDSEGRPPVTIDLSEKGAEVRIATYDLNPLLYKADWKETQSRLR